jgi:hypothetical protein
MVSSMPIFHSRHTFYFTYWVTNSPHSPVSGKNTFSICIKTLISVNTNINLN